MSKKILLAGNSEMVIFKFRRELIEKLLEIGFQVFVAFPQTQFGNGYDTAKKMGCTYLETPINSHGTNLFEDLNLIKSYRNIMKNVRPDIFLSFTIKPNIYGSIAAKNLKIPSIINVSGLGTAVEQPGILQFITTCLYRFSSKNNQTVFFQNTENEEFFSERRIANGKRVILPGSGVNLNDFQLLPYPNDEQVQFIFMARILKEKGIDQYLDAASSIRKKYFNTTFHVMGVCDNADYLQKLNTLHTQGIIKYHGQQKDTLPFQKISCCTIHPTYYPEGMSNVLLESAACGRPIITTDRSGCREVIDDGVNGFICKQRDSEDLINQIEKFLSLTWEQRRDMGLAGRKKVEREFDRQFVVDAYINEIEKALQGEKSGLQKFDKKQVYSN